MRYGLIGRKLSHSYSRLIHEKIWIDNYNLWELDPEELEDFFRYGEWDGINVTIPYKQTVMPYLDELDMPSRLIGCVNAVLRQKGKLFGYNTDYFGFEYLAQRARADFHEKKVLIFGSGATSMTAQAVARAHGAQRIVKLSRDPARDTIKLQSEPDKRFDNDSGSGSVKLAAYDDIRQFFDSQIIINTTPVGMYPNNGGRLCDLSSFHELESVIDVVYNPKETVLSADARKNGINVSTGLPMLVAQAVRSAEIFTGKTFSADNSCIDRLICEISRMSENIVLIGMPGCGKSTVADMIAGRTGRPYYDSDEFIQKRTGKSIGELFSEYGEDGFRDLETEALTELTKLSGAVIATGGGAVIRERNIELIRQNSRVYYIERSLDKLPLKDRPLSKDLSALSEIYSKRAALYKKCADVVVPDSELEEKTGFIINEFEYYDSY